MRMPTPRRAEPHDGREGRRLRAWELHQHGWKQKDIAAALGVTPGAVSQWLQRGRSGALPPARPGSYTALVPRPTGGTPRALGPGSASVWFSGFRLDQQARRGRDQTLVWGHVPSRPCQPRAPQTGLERAETGRAGHAAGRGGHPGGVGRALAGAPKNAAVNAQASVWLDASGFYLLTAKVRT